MAEHLEAEGSRSIEDGALFHIEERLETFKDCSWPFDTGPCTVQKMAEGGFYYCGTTKAPDWTRCIVCHMDMDGWEATDNPLEEHKKNSPKCAYLKLKDPCSITVGDYIDLEKAAIQNFIASEVLKIETDMNDYTAQKREEMLKHLTSISAEGQT